MIWHYTQFPVALIYTVLIIANVRGALPLSWESVMVQCSAVVLVDYLVHQRQHIGQHMDIPWRSLAWTLVLTVFSFWPGLQVGWEMAVLLVCQAVWDNSWHSVVHHREPGKPRTHTDRVWLRWGSAGVALVLLLLLAATSP